MSPELREKLLKFLLFFVKSNFLTEFAIPITRDVTERNITAPRYKITDANEASYSLIMLCKIKLI